MKKIIICIVFFICSIAAYAGYLVDSNNKLIAYSNSSSKEEYGSLKVIELNEDKISYFDQLYLRSDGTFYLSINSYDFGNIVVGKYYINDNFLTLNQIVKYSNNGCFYKDEEKTIVADIDGDKIVLEYEEEKIEFTKGVGNSETENNRRYYTINPIDGSSPKGIINKWKDCSTKITKK